MTDGPNNPAILERDWQLVANTLRRMISKAVLKIEQEMDNGDLYATAEGLEKLAAAAHHACYLDIAAATLSAKVSREGGFG